MRTFIENYLHFMKNCIRPHYEKLKPLKSGFIENSIFENNRDPCISQKNTLTQIYLALLWRQFSLLYEVVPYLHASLITAHTLSQS